MKKTICIILALILSLPGLISAASAEAPRLKIGYLCQTQDYEFHNNALQGTIDACAEEGIELLYQVVGTDPTAIRTAFDSFVTQGINVLINFSCATEANQTIAKLCEQKEIIHICVDVDVNEYGATTYFFGLNNAAAGDLMGKGSVEWLKANLDQEIAHVIHINGSGLGEVVLARTGNAVKYLSENMNVSEDKTYFLDITDYDLASIKQKVQDYLTLCSDKDNIIIYCLSSSWTPAIDAAVTAAGLNDKVYYFCVDGVAQTIETLKAAAAGTDTILKGEVATYPEFYGKTLIEKAKQILNGEDVERYLYSVNGWMTKDNINELYPDL